MPKGLGEIYKCRFLRVLFQRLLRYFRIIGDEYHSRALKRFFHWWVFRSRVGYAALGLEAAYIRIHSLSPQFSAVDSHLHKRSHE